MNAITALTLLRSDWEAGRMTALEAIDEVCDIGARCEPNDEWEDEAWRSAVCSAHVFYTLRAKEEATR